MQFLDANAKPLAGGKVCTFNAGTTTPAATYVDINGVILNTNPIVLDSGGFATIYLANQEYKFTVYDGSGNNLCPNSGVQQWSQDNISAFQPVIGTQTIIFAGVTVDPVGQAGMMDYRSDLSCLRLFTSAWDCILTQNNVLPMTNKTIDISVNVVKAAVNTAGHYQRNNGTQYVDNTIQAIDVPGTSSTIANNAGTPTIANSLAKLLGPPTSVGATTTVDTGGIIGICVSGCGAAGSGVIQQSGLAPCNFDGGTTANNYVQNSTTITGDCHDAGGSSPLAGQIVGRVLSSQGVAGTYTMLLFGPEIRPAGGATVGCTNSSPTTISNTVVPTILLSCSIPANTLVAGNMIAVDLTGIESTAAGMGLQFTVSLGGGTACSNTSATTLVANNQPVSFWAKMPIIAAGGGGTANWNCGYSSGANGGGTQGNSGTVGTPTIAINTTIINLLQVTVTMSVANAGNSVTGQILKAVIF